MTSRRDISSTLKLLVAALAVFIGYQVWWKPAPHPPYSQSPAVVPPPLSESALSAPEPDRWREVPESRLADLGLAPDPTLNLIREELDKGHSDEVLRRLKTLSKKSFATARTRRYVAAIWNNLGVRQEQSEGTANAVAAFKQAVSWDPSNALAYLNLTQAYWELRDPAMTPAFLDIVIRLAPDNPFPHLALADLLLNRGNTISAAAHLERARQRAEHDANHRSYFQKLVASVESMKSASTAAASPTPAAPPIHSPGGELSAMTSGVSPTSSPIPRSPISEPARLPSPATSSQPVRPGRDHFLVQFDGPPDQDTWTRMKAILEFAYEELPQKFGHIPSKPITVVLHTNQRFIETANSPVSADSLFDQSTGTMHLPAIGAMEDLALFSRIARHQFVHAVLFEYMKGRSNAVPQWLMEGLALHLADDMWPDLEAPKTNVDTFVPLASLEGAWKEVPVKSLALAYLEAHLATRNLVDRYSMYSVRQVLNILQTGQTIDAAMLNKLSLPYEQFQRGWEKEFVASAGQD